MTQVDIFDDDAPWAEWLPEIRELLRAYKSAPREQMFIDTEEVASPAMGSYLRIASFYPGRAFRVTSEVLQVLQYGLDDEDVAEYFNSQVLMLVPPDRSMEECLEAMIPHLVRFTESGEQVPSAMPASWWELVQLFPNLCAVMGQFHLDVADEFPDASDIYAAVIDDYLRCTHGYEVAAAADELRRLLRMCSEDVELNAVAELPRWWYLPPDGLTYRGWFEQLIDRFEAHLAATEYVPPPPPNPAYPSHDIRAYGFWERPERTALSGGGFPVLPGMRDE
jgi:hypothetical protein